MTCSKANFEIKLKEKRLKVKTMTDPNRLETLKSKLRRRHYLPCS